MSTPSLTGVSTNRSVGVFVGLFFWVISLAVFFGVIAATGSPILVGMATGLLMGALLLAKPSWNIWVILVLGLMVAGLIPIWADELGSKAVWGISILGFILMISALFRVATKPGVARNTPAFVWVALVFVFYAVFNSLIQWNSLGELLGGFKRYFQVFGLFFALTWLTIDEQDIHRWRKLFVIVALVQLPFAIYELISLVPLRETLKYAYPGLVPVDVVAGTFGVSISGGGANGEMATFLIIVLAFLLARRRENLLPASRLFWLAPFVLAPLFMGETKAVVILLPLMFLLLYRREILSRPHYALLWLCIGALLSVAAAYAYLNTTKYHSFDGLITNTLDYNVYERGHGGYKLNRTSVLTFWAGEQGLHDPVSPILGNGLGSSHDKTGGHIARRYPGFGVGLTGMSTLLWDQGIVGTVLYLAILALAWRVAGRLRRESSEPWVRADAAAIQTTFPLFAFFLFYRIALLEILSFQIVFAALLGYLAWLHRRHAAATKQIRQR
jgi:hypothetical protein